jgi:hypothetical protein
MRRVLAVTAIAAALLTSSTVASAVSAQTQLTSGQSQSATCSGTQLIFKQTSATKGSLQCEGSPTTTTTAATTGQLSQARCTHPTFSTSEASGTKNVGAGSSGPEYWWVNNDAWNGSHGPQTIHMCNQSSWSAVSEQPNNGGAVETYPDTEYDVGGRNHRSTKGISGWSSIDSTFSEAFPSGVGGWDAAYDLWLNNWGTEIMIWNQWSGAQSHWPNKATTPVVLDGVHYRFFDNNGELMFFRDTQVSSGSVDVLAAFKWLVSQGIVKSTDVPTQLEYGVEVCYTTGTERFPLTGLTFALTSKT